MQLQAAQNLANQLMAQHGLIGWKFSWHNRKGAFGTCHYGTREIKLSTVLTELGTEASVKNTILHEIAHALTPGHKHDRVWRSKFISIGGTGERTGCILSNAEDKEKAAKLLAEKREKLLDKRSRYKYLLVCPNGHSRPISRIPKKSSSCGKCCSYFNPAFLNSVIPNPNR